MEEVTITTDEGTITVPLTAVKLPDGKSVFDLSESGRHPKGYVPRTEIAAQVEEAKKGLVKPDDLLGDEDFAKRFAAHRGWQLGEDLKPVAKLDESEWEKRENDWKKQYLDPVVKERDTFKTKYEEREVQSMQDRILRQLHERETAAQESALFTLDPNEHPGIVKQIYGMLKKDQQGKLYYEDEDGIRQYDDVIRGAVEKAQRRDKNYVVFKDPRQTGGSNFSGGKPDGGGKYIKRSEFEKLSPQEQQRIATSGKVEFID